MGGRRAIVHILLVMLIYSLSRLFFLWINHDLYPDISVAHLWEMMLGGMRLDLTAVLYLSSLYLLLSLLPLPLSIRNHRIYQRITYGSYLLPNSIGIIANCMDMVYVRFTDRRTTCTVFSEFQHDSNLGTIFVQSAVQYWYVTLFGVVMLVLLAVGSWSLCRKPYRTARLWQMLCPRYANHPAVYYLRETLVLCVIAYFTVIGIRGGFGRYTRPITISNAMQYVDKPQETAIVLNTPFSLMKSLENTTYQNPHYFPDDVLETVMSPIHLPDYTQTTTPKDTPEPYCSPHSPATEPLNVVVIILESFSKEYIGFYNEEGYTPFLDSLLSQSVTYQYAYASGRKSIDAMPSVLSSIPMLIEPYVVTPYSTNAVSSIADCLRSIGYTTAFFHGAPNGSMGFGAYARSAGFQYYFGMDEYDGEEAFDGTWAIWDEEFLQYFARTMDTLPEPFMTSVFTASSHHPFKVPARYENVFPKGTIPLHQCIGYSDYALRQFFAYAVQQPWFARTLFVLTADHTNQLTTPAYQNTRGLFAIPIAFYCPAYLSPVLHTEQAVSQVDIMPSVLNFVGYKKPFFAFGEDCLTQPKRHPYAVVYNHPLFELLTTDAEYILGRPIPEQTMDTVPMSYLKAFIQQYIDRMTTNRLTIDNGSTSR